MSDKVTRSIYYYELFSISNDKQTGVLKKDKHGYLNRFFQMLEQSQKGICNYSDYLVKVARGEIFIIMDRKDDRNYYFRIVLCRENALPYIEKGGVLESLGSYIDNDQNIAEVTHCIYFGEYGILGAEFNYNGARCSLLQEYISEYDENAPYIQCNPKLNNDALKKIEKNKDYTLFDFEVMTNSGAYTNVLASKNIFKALQASVPESDTLEVVIKRRRKKKNKNKGFEIPVSEDEIKELLNNHREGIRRFKVSQGAFCDSVDLLSDKFVGKTTLIKTEERTINSEEMYSAIENHFSLHVEEYCEKIVNEAS